MPMAFYSRINTGKFLALITDNLNCYSLLRRINSPAFHANIIPTLKLPPNKRAIVANDIKDNIITFIIGI